MMLKRSVKHPRRSLTLPNQYPPCTRARLYYIKYYPFPLDFAILIQCPRKNGYNCLQKFSIHATIVMKKYDYLNALGVHPVK